MNASASAKIAMLRGSMQCYVCGLLGLLPVVGFPFAIVALWLSGRARKHEKQYWNVAKPYRVWGVACAAFGAIIWFIVVALLVYNSVSNPDGPLNGGDYGGD